MGRGSSLPRKRPRTSFFQKDGKYNSESIFVSWKKTGNYNLPNNGERVTESLNKINSVLRSLHSPLKVEWGHR